MNTGKSQYPETLIEAVRYFSDPVIALDFFRNIRWGREAVCPRCGSINVRFLGYKYARWECKEKHPKRQFTVKVGTIMEDSPLGLDKWAVGFWLEVNAKNSVSSYEIHRALGITQKSAWFMLHRIRLAVQSAGLSKIGGNGGTVEADETFVGGLAKNMHKDRRERTIKGSGACGKTAVMGLLERHTEKKCSQIRARVVPNINRDTLHDVIRSHVEPNTKIYTDAWQAYRHLGPEYFHDFVDHADSYVRGAVHTNGLENFWALFKRCIKGTHVSIEPFHLGAYVDSEAFRFNNRDVNDGMRFLMALQGMDGKRLTYKALIGALEAAPESGKDAGSASAGN